MTDNVKKSVFKWKGTFLDEMTKGELIEALEWAIKTTSASYSPQNIRANALGKVEMLKRGER